MPASKAKAFQLITFFAIGAIGLSVFPTSCSRIREAPIARPESLSGYNGVIWKLRGPVRAGDAITLSATHRWPGDRGRFRFVAFESMQENFGFPRPVAESEVFSASAANVASSWTFRATAPVLSVGLAWEGPAAPVALEFARWTNPNSFVDSAYLSKGGAIAKKQVPMRGDFRLIGNEPTLNFPIGFFLAGGAILLLLLARFSLRSRFSNPEVIALAMGCVFAYRAWALDHAPYWAWGSSFIFFLPSVAGWALVAAVPGVGLPLLFYRRSLALPSGRVATAAAAAALVALAWLFRSHRVYGDWEFGFTNHTHAPLTSGWYAMLETLARPSPWLATHLKELVPVAMFLPFLLALRALARGEKEAPAGGGALVALLFLSSSALQCFFGEVEVYSIPSLATLAFLAAGLRCLAGKGSVWLPTILSFIAYLSHVSEALLLFPVVFLWIYDWRHRHPSWGELARRIGSLALASAAISCVYALLIYRFRFHGDWALLNKETTHLGFEILWGSYRHPGVALPVFSLAEGGLYTPPGPDYPIFSWDNLIKVAGFWFHYSFFFFAVPALILLRDRGRQLRDARVAFAFAAFLTYTVYLAFAYVGWLPIVRDWSLFAAYSVMGALLAHLLIRDDQDPGLYWAMIAVNALQAVPWIYMNSVNYDFPW
jgi:hypothetical protein